MMAAGLYSKRHENDYPHKPWADLKALNACLRPVGFPSRPQPNGPPYGGSSPTRQFEFATHTDCNDKLLAPLNNCSIGRPKSPYSHRVNTAFGGCLSTNRNFNDLTQSSGHRTARTPCYDVPQSQLFLPKKMRAPFYYVNDARSWAQEKPPRHRVASLGPTRTKDCHYLDQLERELEKLRERDERTEKADLAYAIAQSLHDEAKRQEAANLVLNEKEKRNDFDTGQWLSDASIARVYSELAAGNHGNIAETPQPLSEEILLMDPAVAFWLMQQDSEDAQLAATDLKLREKQLVVCPVNDNANGGCADGGGHWTLLVAWRSGKEGNNNHNDGGLTFKNFRYYDSMCTGKLSNRSHLNAQKLARILSGDSTYLLLQSKCAQQVNNYDCGVYVIAFSEIITSDFMKAKTDSRSIENKEGDPSWADWVREILPSQVTTVRRYYFNAFKESNDQCKLAL